MDETGTPEQGAIANPETETDEAVDILADIEDETADDETPKDDEPKPRKLKVKIDGQELEVDEDEAVKGYQRQADYSRHMQRVQAEMQQAAQARDMYQQRLEQYIPDQVAKLQRMEQELGVLAVEDPAQWVAKQQEFQTELRRYQQAHAEQEKMQQEGQAQQLVMAERAMVDSIPEWKDSTKRKAEAPLVAEYMRTKIGLSTEDMAAVNGGQFGHAPVVMARKAMLYDQMMQKVAARKSGQSEMTAAPAPVQTVRSSGGASKDPDKMSIEEWMRWDAKRRKA